MTYKMVSLKLLNQSSHFTSKLAILKISYCEKSFIFFKFARSAVFNYVRLFTILELYFWVQFLVAIRLIRDIRDTGGDLKGRCDQRVEEAPYYVDRLLNRGMLGLLRLGLEVNDDLHLIKPPWERT